jgi:hypothetical protein
MSIINDLFRGFIILSLMSLAQHGCSVKDMAKTAAKAHKKGLSSYGGYSRMLSGSNKSWATPETKK